ncbi:MAG: hypothetical protein V3V08_22040, partial [Nannocystaceae bacterium]
MKVLVLYPDMTAAMEDAPDDDQERMTWLQQKVGGYIEHVTYLRMVMDDDTLNAVRGSMFVNEEGGIVSPPLPFNYLGTLLYLENARQRGMMEDSRAYPAIIRGVAIVMPEA